MFIRNSEEVFDNEDLFYCYSIKLKQFLCNKRLVYIGRGTHEKTKKNYWLFLKTPYLSMLLDEWSLNAKIGKRAIQ